MHKTTLEQWALLEKVVELGSFAKAADETHRSQSSVSYNLALLQERLGVTLLTPSGRRAVLTRQASCCSARLSRCCRPSLMSKPMPPPCETAPGPGWIWWSTAFSHASGCSPFCASFNSVTRKLRSG
ncbi:transcriptional regulator [Klebsiella michiganensis]|uniref:Transcriptional regulator n=1 Tax=Klebsiella michiganensis TaxID=1134687 RepID=A0A7H4M4I2_9ENTR|nr:transcriptional regulator [Klebsiella michiganensis]